MSEFRDSAMAVDFHDRGPLEVRPLTNRELEGAMIALMHERDAVGRQLGGLAHLSLTLVDGAWRCQLPTHEGVFL